MGSGTYSFSARSARADSEGYAAKSAQQIFKRLADKRVLLLVVTLVGLEEGQQHNAGDARVVVPASAFFPVVVEICDSAFDCLLRLFPECGEFLLSRVADDIAEDYAIISVGTNTVVNISTTTGDIDMAGDLSLSETITFALGEIIDNVLDGWIKITGSLRVGSAGAVNITEGGNINVNGTITANSVAGATVTATDSLTVDTQLTINANITLINQTNGTYGSGVCDSTKTGVMIYNGSDNIAYICDSTTWQALW